MFHIKLRTSKNEISGTSSYVNKSSNLSVAGKDSECLFSHCEKRHFEPSETISAMWDGTTTLNNMYYAFFSLSIYLSSEYSMMYLCIVPTKNLPRPTRRQRQTWQRCAVHPLVRNHAKTWWGLGRHRQKICPRIAGVSERWFDATTK